MRRPGSERDVLRLLMAGVGIAGGCTADVGVGDAGAGNDSAVVRPDAGDGGPCTPDRRCYADFPCANDNVCLGPTTLGICEDIPCREVCGTTCCSGAQCRGAHREECPARTVCLEHSAGMSPRRAWAACLPPADASSDAGDATDYDYWLQPESYDSSCSGVW